MCIEQMSGPARCRLSTPVHAADMGAVAHPPPSDSLGAQLFFDFIEVRRLVCIAALRLRIAWSGWGRSLHALHAERGARRLCGDVYRLHAAADSGAAGRPLLGRT